MIGCGIAHFGRWGLETTYSTVLGPTGSQCCIWGGQITIRKETSSCSPFVQRFVKKKKTIEGPFDLISRCSVIFCHTPTLSQLCRPDNYVNEQQTNNLKGFFISFFKTLLDFVRFFLNSMKKNARKLSLYLVNLFVIFLGHQLWLVTIMTIIS